MYGPGCLNICGLVNDVRVCGCSRSREWVWPSVWIWNKDFMEIVSVLEWVNGFEGVVGLGSLNGIERVSEWNLDSSE